MTEADQHLIVKMVERIDRLLSEEREASRVSRSRTHERLNEVIEMVAHLDKQVAVAAETDLRVQAQIKALTARLDAIEPTIEAWQDMLKAGRRISWIVGISGLLSGAAIWAGLQWFGDVVVATVRAWLRIP
ncbi:hypothetical protein [Paradevosia shaoguanensis]|uniref:hypothetical protein n=1 Tax=Paradevosia shaoguanensis TaxID=1335043 RepID=UPI003C74EE25